MKAKQQGVVQGCNAHTTCEEFQNPGLEIAGVFCFVESKTYKMVDKQCKTCIIRHLLEVKQKETKDLG